MFHEVLKGPRLFQKVSAVLQGSSRGFLGVPVGFIGSQLQGRSRAFQRVSTVSGAFQALLRSFNIVSEGFKKF